MNEKACTPHVGERQPWRVAAIFVIPYLLLGIAWLGSNPAGAAPDENDHLVKALGIARFDIGTDGWHGKPGERYDLATSLSASSRFVTIPSRLSPSGLTCFRFLSQVTAACQPDSPPTDTGDVSAHTAVGGYPPFMYLAIGLAAQAADTPARAFAAARGVTLLETSLLLLLGCVHLVRWLGRRALAGVVVALTPMAVFSMAIVGTSGPEIFGALGVASVVVVASRHPESVKEWRTQVTLLISGAALVLSRQLGVATMGILVLLLLAVGGWRPVREQIRRPTLTFVATVAALGTSSVAAVLWEWKFDHPGSVGPWASGKALVSFAYFLPRLMAEGIGWFGWLDVRMPLWSLLTWEILLVCFLYLAMVDGMRRDRWVLGVTMTVAISVAYALHATVFFPFHLELQGRHILPLFVLVPVLSGIALTDRLSKKGLVRLFTLEAVLVPAIQLLGLYMNARRYAVGTSSQFLDFFAHAQWAPPLGWYLWLGVGLVGCVALAFILVAFGRTVETQAEESLALVGATPRDSEIL